MKRIVGILLFVALSTIGIAVYGQSDSPLKFKGIPIKDVFLMTLDRKGNKNIIRKRKY